MEHIVFHVEVFGYGSDVSNFDTNLVGNWTDLTHYYFLESSPVWLFSYFFHIYPNFIELSK